jgi:hypothetical protein
MISAPNNRLARGISLPAALALTMLSGICVVIVASNSPFPARSLNASPNLDTNVAAVPAQPALNFAFPLPPANLAVDPKPLNASASATRHVSAASRTAFTLADLQAQCPRDADGSFHMEVPMIFFSAADPAARIVVDGQIITTTAQITRNPRVDPGEAEFQLSRKLTRCCANDAEQFSIDIQQAAVKPPPPDGTWLKVIGRLTFSRDEERPRAVLRTISLIAIDPPPFPVLLRSW